MTGRLAELARRFQDVIDSLSASHTQNTDTILDEGGANEVSAVGIKTHIDDTDIHFEKSDVTKSDVGLSNVDNTSDETVIAEARKVEITAKSSAWTFSMSEGDYYRYTGASDASATVPPNSSQAYPIGAVITIRQAGAGVVTATAGSGVTINGDTKTADQNKAIQLVKIDTNIWDCIGGVA